MSHPPWDSSPDCPGEAGWAGRRSLVVGSLLVIALVVGLAAGPGPAVAGSSETPTEPITVGESRPTTTHVLALHADGTATTTLRLAFDLDRPSERAAFASLRTDTATQTETATAFADRLSTVAAEVRERTGRETAVSDATVTVDTTDGGAVGVVSLSATWTNLAARTGDRLVVTEPYASGFVAESRFVVHPPAQYAILEAAPAPETTLERGVAWTAGTDLDGFRLVAAPAPEATDGPGGTSAGSTRAPGQPGFGPVAVLGGLLLLGLGGWWGWS